MGVLSLRACRIREELRTGDTEPALLKAALGWGCVPATQPAGHRLAPQASEFVTPGPGSD